MAVFLRHCTGLALSVSIALGLAAPAGAQETDGEATFRVFLHGTAVGTEQVIVRHTAEGWTLNGNGRLGPPLDLTTRKLEIRYDHEWHPQELVLDASTKGATINLHTTFSGTQAQSEVNQSGVVTRKADTVAPDSIVLPNLFFGSYEALALRLASIPDGSTFRVYVAPQAEITVKQNARSSQKIETAKRIVDVRTYALTFNNPGTPLDATVWTDEAGRLVRFEVAAQALLVVRDDFSSVATRAQLLSRAGDQGVSIPANGFSLAGTLSQPSGQPAADRKGRYPAIVLVSGSGPADRDETVAGIPIFAQLAGTLADGGYYVLRYDKRGVGQSGGRPESATLEDYATDVLAAVRFLRERKDIDGKRIVLVGHSEGAWTSLIAASRDDDIAAVALIAGASGTGGALVLEQQQYLLDRSNLKPGDRQAKIELQKQIQAAVLGQGNWSGVPLPLRTQAETPWFKSFLAFSPATVMPKVKQPLLIVQGDLDKQVPPRHADALGTLARARKKAPDDYAKVVHLGGVNHLLVPAKTGDIEEYANLTTNVVDPRVGKSILDWLGQALARKK